MMNVVPLGRACLIGSLFAAVLFVSGVVAAESNSSTGPFFGSSKSTIYHVGACEWRDRIGKENLITFSSRSAAESKGYRACKVCRPEEMKVFVSSQSDRFHLFNCEWTGRMLLQNIRVFRSPQDAVKGGYKACDVCKP